MELTTEEKQEIIEAIDKDSIDTLWNMCDEDIEVQEEYAREIAKKLNKKLENFIAYPSYGDDYVYISLLYGFYPGNLNLDRSIAIEIENNQASGDHLISISPGSEDYIYVSDTFLDLEE